MQPPQGCVRAVDAQQPGQLATREVTKNEPAGEGWFDTCPTRLEEPMMPYNRRVFTQYLLGTTTAVVLPTPLLAARASK